MQDSYGREIDYLRISVTDRCNYRCIYCIPGDASPKPERERLPAEEYIRIAEAAVGLGIRKIRITGGEPLVRSDLLTICRGIAAIPGLRELCLTTNGMLLSEMAGDLKAAGVSRLNISLNSMNPSKYAAISCSDTFGRVMDGIRAAEEAGFTGTKLNVVLIKGINDGEIPDFAELTKDRPVSVRFIELMPMGHLKDWAAKHFVSADSVLEACPLLVPAESAGVAELYRIPGYRGTIGLIRPMSRRFCGSCSRLRLTADGMLKPCLHSDLEISLSGLTDEVLSRTIEEAIHSKPPHSCFGEAPSGRDMNEIGG
jgi:GTP 3',8-cyclase